MQSNESDSKVNPTSLHPAERQKWLQALAHNMVALNRYAAQQATQGQVQVQVHQEKDRERIMIRHEQVLSLKFRITDASKGFYEYECLSEEKKEVLPKTALEVMRDVANMVQGPRK
ncbi:hypothetical protein G6514_000621 [Epicoccum nigrum]|nr:hypothetical protein G6514_000621 [Epicoccum nigrum]